MEFFKAKIWLKKWFKIIRFFDTNTKINVIAEKLMENIGLSIKHSSKWELVSYINHSYLFLGLCNNIKVVIRGFKTK